MSRDPYKNVARAKRALQNSSPERIGEFLAVISKRAENSARYWGIKNATREHVLNKHIGNAVEKATRTHKTRAALKRKLGIK